MKRGFHFLCALAALFPLSIMGQSDSTVSSQQDTVELDSLQVNMLDGALIVARPTFESQEEMREYIILRRRIIKTYPYAKLAAEKLDSLNYNLSQTSSRRERRRLIRTYQKFLEERFEPELRKLSIADGAILFKLVHRETGMTVFQLIRQYRGLTSAIGWSLVASWYDNSIRSEYHPNTREEDRQIELILVRCFQNGRLEPRNIYFVE